MLRFDQLDRSTMLRFDQLESVNVRYDQLAPASRGHLFSKISALAIFDGPTEIGFDQLSQEHWGLTAPPPPPLELSLLAVEIQDMIYNAKRVRVIYKISSRYMQN